MGDLNPLYTPNGAFVSDDFFVEPERSRIIASVTTKPARDWLDTHSSQLIVEEGEITLVRPEGNKHVIGIKISRRGNQQCVFVYTDPYNKRIQQQVLYTPPLEERR
ncbi:MAG TPA: hypothetical protein VLI92_00510 [Candidatus Saccharimonadales bacterium]|nr:hypothetical protein [Candidatus Saccharimonadales bacterium]